MDSIALLALLRKKSFAKAYEAAQKEPRLVKTPEVGDGVAGDTPFQWACRFGDKATMLAFLALGADLTKKDEQGDVPLEIVADGSPYATAAQVADRTAMAEALLAAKSPLGAVALARACSLGAGKARALVKLLVDAKAKGDFAEGGETILHVACEYDLPDALEYGLRLGVDPNVTLAQTNFHGGSTALHIAVKKRRTELVEKLVAAGAKPDLVNKRGESPLSLANRELRKILEGQAAPAPTKKKTPAPKDGAALLERLWKAPRDRELLSVYADSLSEQGETSRGEYIQLKLLAKPTAAQTKRASQLLAKDRGRWLGDARKLVSAWEDSETTPGFVSQATVSVENMLAHFEALRALGPEVILRITPIKTRILTKKLAALPLAKVYGLSLYNTRGTYSMNRDWLDDTSMAILGPSLIGLRALVLAPAVQATEGQGFTAAAFESLAPAGRTLESLTIDFSESDPPRTLLAGLGPKQFPKLETLTVVGLERGLQKIVKSAFSATKVAFEDATTST